MQGQGGFCCEAVHFNFSLRQVGAIVGDDAMCYAKSYHNVLDKF
jgi:hypothetical protein